MTDLSSLACKFSFPCGSRTFPAFWVLLLALTPPVAGQTPVQPEVISREAPPSYQIRVERNAVPVRVIVRDAHGRTVGNLRKEDFRLFDSGKPQEIAGFTVETASAPSGETPTPAPVKAGTAVPAPAPAPPAPQRFVALFFDDLHLAIGEIAWTRDAAWRYVLASVRPQDRVALFTSSNLDVLDFTADRDKLHEALFRLVARSRTIPQTHDCPRIGEYQAYLIAVRRDRVATSMANGEGIQCACGGGGASSPYMEDTPDAETSAAPTDPCPIMVVRQVDRKAAQIWNLADLQSLDALDVLEGVVRRLALMPGQRSIVMVSPGFLTETHEDDLDAIINRALRQDVVINALDAAGVFTDLPSETVDPQRLDIAAGKSTMEQQALVVQRTVMANLTSGTGGLFFHNSNDFGEGFRETAAAPEVSYLLTFSPQDIKMDGRFHPIKVTLVNGEHLHVEARRGYFAPPPESAKKRSRKDDVEDLVFSQEERSGLPVEVTAHVETLPHEAPRLAVLIHVDLRLLHFHREAGRSVDTLIFNTALFDREGIYVTGREASLELHLKKETLEKFSRTGINAETVFHLAPGTYRIREVVRDTDSKELSALNANAQVPR